MLKEDDAGDNDDESSDEERFRFCSVKSNWSQGPKVAPPPIPLATKNSFETFDDDDIADDGIAALGDWAHKVTVGKRSQSASKQAKMITNQQELKKLMAANPNVAQLSIARSNLAKI